MGRTNPDYVNYNGGELGGRVLLPGLYKFSTAVGIGSDVTLTGTCDDIYIFQIR
jgi:hypothetical protein